MDNILQIKNRCFNIDKILMDNPNLPETFIKNILIAKDNQTESNNFEFTTKADLE